MRKMIPFTRLPESNLTTPFLVPTQAASSSSAGTSLSHTTSVHSSHNKKAHQAQALKELSKSKGLLGIDSQSSHLSDSQSSHLPMPHGSQADSTCFCITELFLTLDSKIASSTHSCASTMGQQHTASLC